MASSSDDSDGGPSIYIVRRRIETNTGKRERIPETPEDIEEGAVDPLPSTSVGREEVLIPNDEQDAEDRLKELLTADFLKPEPAVKSEIEYVDDADVAEALAIASRELIPSDDDHEQDPIELAHLLPERFRPQRFEPPTSEQQSQGYQRSVRSDHNRDDYDRRDSNRGRDNRDRDRERNREREGRYSTDRDDRNPRDRHDRAPASSSSRPRRWEMNDRDNRGDYDRRGRSGGDKDRDSRHYRSSQTKKMNDDNRDGRDRNPDRRSERDVVDRKKNTSVSPSSGASRDHEDHPVGRRLDREKSKDEGQDEDCQSTEPPKLVSAVPCKRKAL